MATIERLLTAGLVEIGAEDPTNEAEQQCLQPYFPNSSPSSAPPSILTEHLGHGSGSIRWDQNRRATAEIPRGPAAYLTDPVIAADVEEEVDLFVLDKAAQDGEVTMGVSPRFWTAHERYGRPAKPPDRNAPGSHEAPRRGIWLSWLSLTGRSRYRTKPGRRGELRIRDGSVAWTRPTAHRCRLP